MSQSNYMNTDNPWIPNFLELPGEKLFNNMTNWGNTTPMPMPTPPPAAEAYHPGMGANMPAPALGNTGFNPTFWDKMFGYQKGDVQYGAMAPALLQGAGSLAQSFLGWGQLSEGKRQNAIAQDNWQKQYDNQATLTNASLRDRQSARVAANPGAYQSVGEYMQQNKVG
jgi:hypothetical protein